MKKSLFTPKKINESDDCCSEFSIDNQFSEELNKLCQGFIDEIPNGFKKPNHHHVTLLYGYRPSES